MLVSVVKTIVRCAYLIYLFIYRVHFSISCSDVFRTMSLSEDSTDNNDIEVASVLANGG